MSRDGGVRRQRGFTIVEVVAAMTVMAIVGLSLMQLIRISHGGARATADMTRSWGGLRKASGMMADDLAQSAATKMTLATVNGEQQVTLQQPVAVAGGAVTWGACDLAQPVATRMRPGWFVRWTVRTVNGERQLVRQLLDAAQSVKVEQVVVRKLRAGTGSKPGFKVQASGQMWTITLSADGPNGAVEMVSFDVGLRNA